MVDHQIEPELTDEEWVKRFIEHMVAYVLEQIPDEDEVGLREYAQQAATATLSSRKDYQDPEEAAEVDISYWEGA